MTDKTVRVEFCPRCQERLSICRSCDRGQLYCSRVCSALARRDSLRVIRRRYRESDNGRKTHREAERRRRARCATVNTVGDQGSQLPRRADRLNEPTVEPTQLTGSAQTKSAVLHCCACQKPARFVLSNVDGLWRPRGRPRASPGLGVGLQGSAVRNADGRFVRLGDE